MSLQNKIPEHFFHKSLIIDIETVPCVKKMDELPERMQGHWRHKTQFLKLQEDEIDQPQRSFDQRAGIYAEFGKIVCIGLGKLLKEEDEYIVRIKAIRNDDERQVLEEFCDIVNALEEQVKGVIFCGHNIKEFDLPYICRRLLVHGMALPGSLQLSGKKPWEIHHQDTLELWRFGDYKHYITLDLLAACLDVPSSKTEMQGSEVAGYYWLRKELELIARYCMADIYTTALTYVKLKGWSAQLRADYV